LQDITTPKSNMTNYTQLFNTLTASDLPNSLHLRNTFFCKGRRELRTDIENSCLTALYLGMPDKARTQCQFRITTTKIRSPQSTLTPNWKQESGNWNNSSQSTHPGLSGKLLNLSETKANTTSTPGTYFTNWTISRRSTSIGL